MSLATYSRSRRSAILREEMKTQIENTPPTETRINCPTELDALLEQSLIWQFDLYKPYADTLLYDMRIHTPSIVGHFHNQKEKEL